MKRGKRFIENDNMFIYVGTVIFILLAISIGIIMYMSTKTGVRIENADQFSKETQNKTETVNTEMGKTVEEQQSSTQTEIPSEEVPSNETKETNTEVVQDAQQPETTVTPDEPDTVTDTNAPTENEVTENKKEITFAKPTEGEIICEYAKDNLIYSETLKEWITHTAIDIKADKTSVIKSAADGVVKSIVNDPRYGLTVVITHEQGYETVYSNLLTAEFVVEGEEVTQGQTIGTVGNTASFESNMECHLHFELLKDGEYLDPTIHLK
ncbi:MAG: M23 family metallopeptidase [Clostridia bacterium]|nr:M23 family metallopeptidase [Clostridia bacterium]